MLNNCDEMLNILKKSALGAYEAEKPVNIVFGVVKSVSPLKISIDYKLVIESDEILQGENSTKLDLKSNDKVILVRLQGGQKFYILDKVVE